MARPIYWEESRFRDGGSSLSATRLRREFSRRNYSHKSSRSHRPHGSILPLSRLDSIIATGRFYHCYSSGLSLTHLHSIIVIARFYHYPIAQFFFQYLGQKLPPGRLHPWCVCDNDRTVIPPHSHNGTGPAVQPTMTNDKLILYSQTCP